MTYEESYKYWKRRYELAKDFRDTHWECGEAREHREWCEHMKNAYLVLEKQMPQKIKTLKTSITLIAECKCGNMFAKTVYDDWVFCPYCGQAIDWSEVEV